jgi:phosphohistidine phosphatase
VCFVALAEGRVKRLAFVAPMREAHMGEMPVAALAMRRAEGETLRTLCRNCNALRRLLLLRHAKAEPGGPELDDHDRALTERGISDAAAMARYIRRQGYVPSRIFCSTATRTRQTVEPLLNEYKAAVEWLGALYLAAPGKIIATAQDADAADSVVMLVGHNPGLEQAASMLSREAVKPAERDFHDLLEEKFPTAALAVIDFDIASWSRLAPGGGKLVDFVRPKDL